MVEYDVDDDFHSFSMACGNHVFELSSTAPFALDLIGHGLIVCPPLVALDVFHSGADYVMKEVKRRSQTRNGYHTLYVAIPSGCQERAFVRNAIPVPSEK